jgi:TetR/AcrR family transcriptional regulator, transcriptional repressor for nem operon
VPARTTNSRPGSRKKDTGQRILDVAEQLVQVRGFNAFSYGDIATKLGITTASLHYHFPGKAELGRALITRYTDRFTQALAQVDRETDDAPAKLSGYADFYADVLRGHRMCLCGMLAAEYRTLPKPITDAVVAFFDDNETWLEGVLEQGRAEHTLRFEGSARETARMIISSLEGAMLVGRPYGDPQRFRATAETLLTSLVAPVTRGEPAGGKPSSRRA